MAVLKEIQADALRVFVADKRENMGKKAAELAGSCIRKLLAEKSEINMIFAAAPSQNETLEQLIREKDIDWTRVNAFHMDEYVGLREDAPQAFGTYLYEHLFSKLPFKTVNYLHGNAADIDAECARYSALLKEYPADIVMLGIGENGHIAFNDPWVADFNDPLLVKAVPLDPVCRNQQVHDGCFTSLEEVPEKALTLTIPALTRASHLFCTVPAATKKNAVTQTVRGEISEKVPATIMRTHPDATMFCDPDSGAGIMTDRLRVAIIGQGRSGRNIHGAFFRSDSNDKFKVVAVVDALEDRRERAREEYNCDVYSDYRELYGRTDIDLVINSSFSHLHYPITMDLLSHGFNVVVEKPFSAHKEECEAMIRVAKDHHVMLSVFQQSHFAPYYRRIREIMDSGILGRIVEIRISFNGFARRWDWQCSSRYCGGALRNTCPHPLEQALDILDMDTLPQISSRLDNANSFGDAEDFVKILLLAPGKPVIDIEASSCDAYNDGVLYRIHGTRGALKATMSHISYQYFREEEAPAQKLTLEPLYTPEGTPSYCTEVLPWHKEEEIAGTSFDSAVKSYYDNIYAHLTAGEELIIRPEKIVKEIELIEEVHRQNPLLTDKSSR